MQFALPPEKGLRASAVLAASSSTASEPAPQESAAAGICGVGCVDAVPAVVLGRSDRVAAPTWRDRPQFHPTILARIALIPQRHLNSYNFQYQVAGGTGREHDSMWQEGDFVINVKGCDDDEKNRANGIDDRDNGRVCEAELRQYYQKWEQKVDKVKSRKHQLD